MGGECLDFQYQEENAPKRAPEPSGIQLVDGSMWPQSACFLIREEFSGSYWKTLLLGESELLKLQISN